MSLATIVAHRPLVGIQINALEQRHSLAKLQIVASELGDRISVWTIAARGWHDCQEVLTVWEDDFELEDSVIQHLSFKSLPSGIAVYLDIFTAIASLAPTQQVRAKSAIKNLFFYLQQHREQRVIFLETGEIPSELTRLIYNYEFPLPEREEMKSLLVAAHLPTDVKFLNILSGLTLEEMKIALQQVRSRIDVDSAADALLSYKYELFKSYGLEFIGKTTTKDIGGLDIVKEGLEGVKRCFSDEARNYNIPIPRGWILVGVPGTGKTYFAKICAQKLGFPLINIGIDVAKSGGVTKFKQLLKRIDACEPCIPYFDEFDKFFMGDNSGEFLGVILTWLNEKTSKTFVLATLNRLENLPPELTRAGRFDRAFYVDFPTAAERKEILQLHLSRFDRAYCTGDGRLTPPEWMSILERTEKCTGAELAQIAIEAAISIFYQLREGTDIEIHLSHLLAGRNRVRTLYCRNPEGVMAIENRAKQFTEPASSNLPHPFSLPQEDLYALSK